MPNLAPPPADQPAADEAGDSVLTEEQMREFTRRNIVAALERSNWRVSGRSGAAELLGVRPTTLADRIRSFGIEKPARPRA